MLFQAVSQGFNNKKNKIIIFSQNGEKIKCIYVNSLV